MTRGKTPTLRGQTIERAPVSQSNLDDPLYVAVSATSLHDVAWAVIDREHELTNQGYEPVRPEELEQLPGGRFTPLEKHFGVRFRFDKDAPIVRRGQHMLMKISKRERQDRLDAEGERMRKFKPTKSDAGEQANLKDEGVSTLKDELKS